MFYIYFLALSAFEMLVETWISARNSRVLLQRGAVEIAPLLLPVMVLLYVIMYVGSLAEYLWIPKEIPITWMAIFGLLFVFAKLLKLWAITSLGTYWTMRVLVMPQSTVVTSGPYRWIRHPNYVAVLMEIAATTLIGKSLITFIVVIVLFSVTLVFRIQQEEAALKKYTDYAGRMGVQRRFLP